MKFDRKVISGSAAALPSGTDAKQLFIQLLPERPLCGSKGGDDFCRRPISEALAFPLVQHSLGHQRAWIVIDIDKSDCAWCWEDHNFVAPNFVATNPANGHAHLAWRLTCPVAYHSKARSGPMEFAESIRRAMTRRLGGDPWYGNLICKNPFDVRWRTEWLTLQTYSLQQLAEPFDQRELSACSQQSADLGLGRNSTLFEELRLVAYGLAVRLKRENRGEAEFISILRQKAYELNRTFNSPLPNSEIRSTARSVTRWVWARFSPESFSSIQKGRSALAAKARKNKFDMVNSAIQSRLSEMGDLTMPASELAKEMGMSRQSIYNHLKAIRRG